MKEEEKLISTSIGMVPYYCYSTVFSGNIWLHGARAKIRDKDGAGAENI